MVGSILHVHPTWRTRGHSTKRGGICYTMTPLLNQLSLFEAAQSFLNPDADFDGDGLGDIVLPGSDGLIRVLKARSD